MRLQRAGDGERTLAVFIDFENLALGFAGKRDRFQIEKVLERLVEKGKIVTKKAYADWSRFGIYAQSLHEAAIELIEIPKRSITGKNSADIRLVVDAVDLAYSKDHIDTFVIVSGDSDFSPLVSKLKELGKHVIGLGLVDATSNLLRDNCDEFIYYEDLDRAMPAQLTNMPAMPEAKRKVFALLMESLLALRRENKETIFSSMAKDTMKRKRPSFNEEYHGYRTFSELLEDAARSGLVELEKHKGSGTYVITRFGGEMRNTPLNAAPQQQLPHPQPMAALPPRAPVQPSPAERDAYSPPRQEPHARPSLPPRPNQPQGLGPGNNFVNGHAQPGGRSDARPLPVPPSPPVLPPPLQQRPAAPAKPAPQPQPQQPRRPAPVQAARDDDDEDDRGLVLGRSLIEEIDDDDDELPSYGPARPQAKPVQKPESKPGARGQQPKPRQQPRAAVPRPTGVPPVAEPAPRRKAPDKPVPAPVPAPMPPVSRKKPIAPKPPVEEEGFGAGLDE